MKSKEEYPHHYDHDKKGIALAETLGERIGVPKNWIKAGKVSCAEHMRGGIFYKMKPAKKVEFIERIDKSILGLEGLQIVVKADKLSCRSQPEGNVLFEPVGKRCLKEINGKYIIARYGKQQGERMRQKLHEERVKWMKEEMEKAR